jgi:hypothetical protein
VLLRDDLYLHAYLGSPAMPRWRRHCASSYTIADAIARAPMAWRQLLPFLVVLPFWTSFLIRVSAWIEILKPSGPLNRLMLTAWLTKARSCCSITPFRARLWACWRGSPCRGLARPWFRDGFYITLSLDDLVSPVCYRPLGDDPADGGVFECAPRHQPTVNALVTLFLAVVFVPVGFAFVLMAPPERQRC